jgi:hypothetical protein
MGRRTFSVLVATAALTASGCGSSDKASTSSSAGAVKAAPATIKIEISGPAEGTTVRDDRIVVRGTVTPVDAAVQITGLTAAVENGVFHRSIPLPMGQSRLDVVATKAGMDPKTAAVSVSRARSTSAIAKEKAAADKRAAATAAHERAAASRRAARRKAAANASVTVPNQVGERLDVAEETLLSHGLRYKEVGGGSFGVVVKSNWTVCESRPSGGAQVRKHTRVALIVDREC